MLNDLLKLDIVLVFKQVCFGYEAALCVFFDFSELPVPLGAIIEFHGFLVGL